MAKILVGISGGLDSTFAVDRLLREGHEVGTLLLDMHGNAEIGDAKKIAETYGVPFDVLDTKERFDACVVDYFVEEYARGRTPNPCVRCNRTVKIVSLCEYAKAHGYELVATGHYANKYYDKSCGRYSISFAKDMKKDQSYVLWELSQEQIEMLVFPLGDMAKSEVREYAASKRLEVADRPESQEICFIPDDDYVSFIEARKGVFPRGPFLDLEGKVIGEHKGIIHYTVGQRKGLGMSFGEHMFVKSIDAATNSITLCRKGEEYSDRLWVDELNFVGMTPIEEGELELDVKLRYAAPPVPATVRIGQGRAEVILHSPARAVTPGQSAVFYRDGRIMLGGIIQKE